MGSETSRSDASFGRVVDLSGKDLEALPVDIGRKKIVKTLILSRNRLRQLPDSLTSLKVLNLSDNGVKSLSDGLIDSILTYPKLETLDLSKNELVEVPHLVNRMRLLYELNLSGNQLETLDVSESKVHELDISENKFCAIPKLPSSLRELNFDFNFLKSLDLRHQKLSKLSLSLVGLEVIPDSVAFPNLRWLNLSMNRLKIMPDLWKLCPKIEYLNLNDNLLTEFPKLPMSIEQLFLRNNFIEVVPNSLADYTNMWELDLCNNKICTMPEVPDTLEMLLVDGNEIIAFSESYTPSMKKFSCADNNLVAVPKLEGVMVKDCNFAGNWIRQFSVKDFCQNVVRIDFTGNMLTSIPSSLIDLPRLAHLLLADNRIKSLPEDIGQSRSLMVLNVSSNPLEKLPSVLPPMLTELIVGYCRLKYLPSSIKDLPRLVTLIAPGNRITKIPEARLLRTMNFSKNRLKVFPFLPESIVSVDLSMNQLTSMPEMLRLPNLSELDLSFNKIPALHFWKTPKLQCLRISNNPISQLVRDGTLDGVSVVDATNTNITFMHELGVGEFLISYKKYMRTSIYAKGVVCDKWVSYAECKGSRLEMEDSVIVRPFINKDVDLYGLFDGHGGKKMAVHGSAFVTEAFVEGLSGFGKDFMKVTIRRLERVLRQTRFRGGTTLALAMYNGSKIVTGHVGDTRAIVVRENGEISFSTVDHKPSQRKEYERIHKQGGKIVDGRINGILAPGRSVGDFGIVGNTAKPEAHIYATSSGDKWLIIACDGVWDVMNNEMVGMLAKKAASATRLAYDIRNMACVLMSSDNISVIVVDLHNRPPYKGEQRVPEVIDDDDRMPLVKSGSFDEELLQQVQLKIDASEDSPIITGAENAMVELNDSSEDSSSYSEETDDQASHGGESASEQNQTYFADLMDIQDMPRLISDIPSDPIEISGFLQSSDTSRSEGSSCHSDQDPRQ